MDNKDIIKRKNEEIEQLRQDWQGKRGRLLAELEKLDQDASAAISKAQSERDQAALDEKMKQFPADLVNNHKTCSVCGEAMRPFEFMESGQRVKAWACSVGSLQPGHDLVRL